VRYPLLSDLGSKHRAKPIPPKPWRSSPQDGQLMAEKQNLRLELRTRFEQRCNKTEDEAYRVDHSAQI
jgi:hypothetical protein